MFGREIGSRCRRLLRLQYRLYRIRQSLGKAHHPGEGILVANLSHMLKIGRHGCILGYEYDVLAQRMAKSRFIENIRIGLGEVGDDNPVEKMRSARKHSKPSRRTTGTM
jgi:hypothetical protein